MNQGLKVYRVTSIFPPLTDTLTTVVVAKSHTAARQMVGGIPATTNSNTTFVKNGIHSSVKSVLLKGKPRLAFPPMPLH